MLYNLMKKANEGLDEQKNSPWKSMTKGERIVAILIILLYLICGVIQAITYESKGVIYYISLGGLAITGILFVFLVKKDEKYHRDEQLEYDISIINKLQVYLADEMKITSRNQYCKLISLYEEHIKSLESRRDKRLKILISCMSGLITVISIIISNKDAIGNMFLAIMSIIAVIISVGIVIFITYKFVDLFDDTLYEYNKMVEKMKFVEVLLEEE